MKNKQSTRYHSNLQEQYVAKQLGGVVQPNSGAAKFYSGDVVIPETMVIECKTTLKYDAKSWSIKREWLEQNNMERLNLMLPHSALAVSLDPTGKNNIYVINEQLMKFLVKRLRGEETI
jgi:hypothetical protein|nr:MAG TPA: hypothetical protein [Caudoviricetes sp.]